MPDLLCLLSFDAEVNSLAWLSGCPALHQLSFVDLSDDGDTDLSSPR